MPVIPPLLIAKNLSNNATITFLNEFFELYIMKRVKLVLLHNEAYNNIDIEGFKNLINPFKKYFFFGGRIKFHRESTNFVEHVKSLDEIIEEKNTIGVSVSSAQLIKNDNLCLGGGYKNSTWVYHPTINDYNKSQLKNTVGYEDYVTRFGINSFGHEIIEKVFNPTDEMIEKYRRDLIKILESRVKNYDFSELKLGYPNKHGILKSIHEPYTSCVASLVITPMNFMDKLNHVYQKNGLCNDCHVRLEEGIQAFLAK